MRIPKAVTNLIESFEKLPGVGPKSAERLTFYLLHVPQGEIDKFADNLKSLKSGTVLCSICFNVGEHDPCEICDDRSRDQGMICVVEQPLDVLALEKSNTYKGVYHVLHGKIDPLNSIGPDEIFVNQLLGRVRESGDIKEVILATNPTMEGEATAMYISKQIKNINSDIIVTRIGRGLPVGADIEYADSTTLQSAMQGRSAY
jgi:recombination protein RecR